MLGLGKIAKKIFGTPNDRKIKSVKPLIDAINALEDKFKQFSDAQIVEKTQDLHAKVSDGASLETYCQRRLQIAVKLRRVRLGYGPLTCN